MADSRNPNKTHGMFSKTDRDRVWGICYFSQFQTQLKTTDLLPHPTLCHCLEEKRANPCLLPSWPVTCPYYLPLGPLRCPRKASKCIRWGSLVLAVEPKTQDSEHSPAGDGRIAVLLSRGGIFFICHRLPSTVTTVNLSTVPKSSPLQ